ncbi:MAG: hypothetical protein H7Y18_09750 [Clostridiaceae bacterium]|nr:hypothetical protein [Clostridiaceae bacterium]
MEELERKEYLEALEELKQAMRNLNYAEPNYVEIAVFQVKVAQGKVDAFINERR